MWVVKKKKVNTAGVDRMQTGFFLALTIGVLVISAYILLPYLGPLFSALILSIVFRPLYEYINKKTKHSTLSSFTSVLIVLLLIILPIIFFGTLLFNEVIIFYNGGNVSISANGLTETINTSIRHFFGRFAPDVSFDINSYVAKFTGWFVNNFSSFFSKFVDIGLGLFIATLGLFYLFRDGEFFIKKIMFLSPLSDRYDEEIFKKIEQSVNSVVRGSLAIALVQGILSGIGFFIFGIPHAILWASVTMLTSLIPTIGTAIVLVPSVVYLYFTGDVSSAVGLLVWGSVGVGFIDNLLGPHILGRGIKIHPFLVLLSVIGGISLFGPIGFMAGPVILSLLFALLEIYPSIVRATSQTRR